MSHLTLILSAALSREVVCSPEIAGQIEHSQDKLRQLVIDLDHIDAAIHIFDPLI